MTGSRPRRRRRRLIVQPRDRRLLQALETMRIVDREQAKRIAGFGSTSRFNARALGLVRLGLLRHFFIGTISGGRKAIYTLSPKGAQMVEARQGGIYRPANKTLLMDRFVEHQLHVNEIYLEVTQGSSAPDDRRLRRWLTFGGPVSPDVRIIPDGYFEIEDSTEVRSMFVEVDLGSESSRTWKHKTEAYLRLAVSGDFERRFNQERFRVLVIASTDRRLQSIRSVVGQRTDKIFWFSTFPLINTHGFWSAVWLRPTGQTRQPLI